MPADTNDPLPHLDGVEHRFVTTEDGIDIHVALAGPADGPPLMLVHGFPQHWWEWRHQIGPLAADGVRVIVPDLRGAGWSDAPDGEYYKADMANDLASVLRSLDCGPVKVAAHDWGGPVAYITMANHPDLVSAFMGFNTTAPVAKLDFASLKHSWAFWYQLVLMNNYLGPKLLSSEKRRFARFVVKWVGGGFTFPQDELDIYLDRFSDPARAKAGSQWYRTFQLREARPWIKGEYADTVDIPLRWVLGLDDPVVAPAVLRPIHDLSSDIDFEEVPNVGHWIIEQAPDLVLERLRDLMKL